MIMNKKNLIPAVILLVFLVVGLLVFRDYGASADEHSQIDAGHIIWKFLCEKLGRPVPGPIADAPELLTYKNSYYGQAATFPTVLIEALRGFTLDSSTVLRIRHFWNFLTYFAGLCCFAALLQFVYRDWKISSAGLLLMIFLPRIFGDIFYNDRDTMLLAWMMISVFAFCIFCEHPGPGTCLLCAAAFAVVFNTRLFGAVLLLFPCLYMILYKRTGYIPLMLVLTFLFWYLLSPIAWGDPFRTLPQAIRHLTTQQRFLDTNNESEVLFFGRLINETQLPWYYLPAYIFVTTPVFTSAAALAGTAAFVYSAGKQQISLRKLFGTGMAILIVMIPLVGILFHPTLYNGWRHFYFMYLPIVWMAAEGISLGIYSKKLWLRTGMILFMASSFVCSLLWVIQAHPYEIIYLNPLFRSRWIGKFDRDYWILSTTECMDYVTKNAQEIDINVVDKYTFIEYTIIGLPPQERERFHTIYHSAQPVPFEYLFFNYVHMTENDQSFDYYVPVYAVERDGIKLAEVFRRSHNDELSAGEIVKEVITDHSAASAAALADGDFSTSWYGNDAAEGLVFAFDREYEITSLEIFPAEGSEGFPNVRVSASTDGVSWTPLECTKKGSNGVGFPLIKTAWLRLQSDSKNPGIRDILFYGN